MYAAQGREIQTSWDLCCVPLMWIAVLAKLEFRMKASHPWCRVANFFVGRTYVRRTLMIQSTPVHESLRFLHGLWITNIYTFLLQILSCVRPTCAKIHGDCCRYTKLPHVPTSTGTKTTVCCLDLVVRTCSQVRRRKRSLLHTYLLLYDIFGRSMGQCLLLLRQTSDGSSQYEDDHLKVIQHHSRKNITHPVSDK